ncbi:hypothetical protein N7507_005880 [Penicillium longicatenatum]|nr:hypothetical protein N7507_005880 [Penicillium longicatenatum]
MVLRNINQSNGEEEGKEIHTTESVRSPARSSGSGHEIRTHARNRKKHQAQKARRKLYKQTQKRRRNRDDHVAHPDSNDDDPNSPVCYEASAVKASGFPSTGVSQAHPQSKEPLHFPDSTSPLIAHLSKTNAAKDKLPAAAEGSTMGGSVSAFEKEQETAESRLFALLEEGADHVSNSGVSSSALSSPTASPKTEGPSYRRKKNGKRSRGKRETRAAAGDEASKVEGPPRDDPHLNEDALQEEAVPNTDLPSSDAQTTGAQQASHMVVPTAALQSLSIDKSSQKKHHLRVVSPLKLPRSTAAASMGGFSHGASFPATDLSKTPGRNPIPPSAGDPKGKASGKKRDLAITASAVGTSQNDSSSVTGLSKMLSSNLAAVEASSPKDGSIPSAGIASMLVSPKIVISKPEEDTQCDIAETPDMPNYHDPSSSQVQVASSRTAVHSGKGIDRELSLYSTASIPSSSGYSMTSIQSESPYSTEPTPSSSGYSMISNTSATGQNTPTQKGPVFWDITTEGFPCAKSGCDKICAQWDGQSCICPACGPLSKIRYCKKEHLREAVREHWPVCGYYPFQRHIKKSAIQDEVMAGPPMIPAIEESTSLERHRQALWLSTALSEGDYFIFNDRAERIRMSLAVGHPDVRCTGKLLLAVQWSSPPEKDRFRRLLAVSLFASEESDHIVSYLYKMIRDNLLSQGSWTREVEANLWEQLWLETEVDFQRGLTHACITEWTGAPPRNCPDSSCVAEREKMIIDYGIQSGFEQLCQFMESQYWILRANRVTHPTCKSIEGRILGEGYGDWVAAQDRRLFRRGEGWDGVGTGPMEHEGRN